jgi:competence transcription factor ComK
MRIIFLISTLLGFTLSYSQTYTWNGVVSSDWATSTNWTPVGIPDAGHTVVINSGSTPFMPVLDASRSIATLTISNGILNLAGFTLSTTANANMNGGTIQNGILRLNTFSTMANMTFNGPLNLVKTGGNNNSLAGGNTFFGDIKIEHEGTGRIRLGATNPDVFNGPLQLVNSSNNVLELAYSSAGNQFNDDIQFEATSGQGIRIGVGGGTSDFAIGQILSVGPAGFTAGELSFRNFTQHGSVAQSLVLSGTALLSCYNAEWEADVDFRAPQMLTNGSIYRGTAYLEKTGATVNSSSGGNDFLGITELRNSGTAEFRMGNGGANPPDIFRDETTLSNTGTSYIRICFNTSGNEFRGNLILNSTSGTGIRIGEGGGSTSIFAGNTISIGALGFSSGELRFQNFSQLGATTQNLTLTGTSLLSSYTSNWQGAVNFRAPQIFTTGTNYFAATYLEKTGGTGNNSTGGNRFHTTAELRNSGSAEFRMGNVAANPADIFDGVTTFTNTGTSLLNIAYSSLNNQFNNNVILQATSGTGILFGSNNGSATLSSGNSFSIGALGFSSGQLQFRNITQVGGASQNITTTGNVFTNIFECTWNGPVTIISPQLVTRGTNYVGITYLEKTGGSGNNSTGGNRFYTTAEIRNSGSAEFRMGNVAANPADIFDGVTTFTNTGTSVLTIAYASLNNEFNNNVILQTTSGTGILFGSNNGSATLSSGSSFSIGALGFSSGQLQFRNITQLGGASQNITTTGNVITNIFECTWNGPVTIISPQLVTRGTNYVGVTYLEKTGGTGNNSTGGNRFHTTTELRNSGTAEFRMGNVAANPADIFDGVTTFTNTGTSVLTIAYASLNNQLNNNVILQSTGGTGVLFGSNNGSATLSGGNSFSIGALGFSVGQLQFRNVNQLGGTAQTLALTGTATLNSYSSLWTGDVSFSSPRILTRESTYDGTVLIHKTGTGTDNSEGGNVFNGFAEIRNTSNGSMMDANTLVNTFNSHVLYVTTSTGTILPSNNVASNYHGDIRFNTANQLVLGNATSGRIRMVGSGDQNITDLGASPLTVFRRLTIDKTGGDVILNVPIAVNNELNLINRNIVSTSTNVLIMNNASTVSAVSDASYVQGPVRKIGNQAFTFPIGKNGFYRPAGISAPTTNTHHFTAEYFAADPDGAGYDDASLETPIVKISDCEYWIIDRTNGASPVSVTLSYRQVGPDEFDCSAVESQPELLVARWDGALWRNHGNGGTFGVADDGTVITAGAVTSFSPFTLATSDLVNPLPVELIEFNAELKEKEVLVTWSTSTERDSDYFTIERSLDGETWVERGIVEAAGNSTHLLQYTFTDVQIPFGTVYYRLKQTDFDGTATNFETKVIENFEQAAVSIYPNPVDDNFQLVNHFTIKVSVTIHTVDGKIIDSLELGAEQSLNVKCDSWSSGVYFIKLHDAEGELNQLKVLKN